MFPSKYKFSSQTQYSPWFTNPTGLLQSIKNIYTEAYFSSVKTVWEETTENRDHSIQGRDSKVYGFIEWNRIHREIKTRFISLICFYSQEDSYWTIKQTPEQWENPLTMALKHSRNGGTVFKLKTHSRIKMPL